MDSLIRLEFVQMHFIVFTLFTLLLILIFINYRIYKGYLDARKHLISVGFITYGLTIAFMYNMYKLIYIYLEPIKYFNIYLK